MIFMCGAALLNRMNWVPKGDQYKKKMTIFMTMLPANFQSKDLKEASKQHTERNAAPFETAEEAQLISIRNAHTALFPLLA